MTMMMKLINFLKRSLNKIMIIKRTMIRMKNMMEVKMLKRKVPKKKHSAVTKKESKKGEK